jgi:hypothetical protein
MDMMNEGEALELVEAIVAGILVTSGLGLTEGNAIRARDALLAEIQKRGIDDTPLSLASIQEVAMSAIRRMTLN